MHSLVAWFAILTLGWHLPVRLSAQGAGECAAAPPLSLDSAMAQGRWWHSARLLARLPPGRATIPAADVVVRARVAEGLGRWGMVDSLLRRARGGDSLPEFIAVAARADEHAGRWAAAADRYRRLTRMETADEDTRAAAAARLAVTFEQLGRLDSASAAWRRAAQLLPDIADWFALQRADHERDTALAFASLAGMRTPATQRRADLLVAQRRLQAGNQSAALDIYRRLGQWLDVARVEYLQGQRRTARLRADTMLFADPTRPTGLLAATFLTERYDTLSVAEYLAVSRAYRARADTWEAARYALLATRVGRDTSVGAWLEFASILSQRHEDIAAMRAVDSAGARAGTRRAALIGAARARVMMAADRWEQADNLLGQLVRVYAGDTAVARAVLLYANRHRARGELMDEMRRYGVLLARFGDSPAANLGRFRLGLIFYAAGAVDTARTLVLDAAARDTDRVMGTSPQYWQARMRYEAGDSSAAADLRRIAIALPISYYGTRARELLGDTAFVVDTAPSPPRLGTFPAAKARERIRMLASLGFETEARAEAMGWIGDTSASVQVLLAAAGAAAEAGFARESIWIGEAARQRAGLLPGVARALFPVPFARVIDAEAEEQCIDPLLLAAIIRQESRFDPHALSPVGARGIAQVMPATGRQYATLLRIPDFDPDLLFVPDLNIHLGSRYLRDRATTDSFPVYAVLAAYNAGPARVRSWRRWPEFADPDLFAERIAINETNDYVKTVYMSYVWYRRLYAPSAPSGAAQPSRPLAPYP